MMATGPASAGGHVGTTFNDEETALVHSLAAGIVDRRLGAPAAFLLESLQPMNFVISQALAFFLPIVSIVYDRSKIAPLQELLEKREAIPYILKVIHQLEEARRG